MRLEQERREPDHIVFEEIVANAKDVLLREGQHLPMVIMDTPNMAYVSHIPDMPPTHGERVEYMRFLGQVVARSGRVSRLEQAFMVSEGWLREADGDNKSLLRPSQDPNRKEVLIVSGIQLRERKKRLELFEIVRDEDQRVVRLDDFLPNRKKQEETVEIPLLEAFLHGFQSVFRAKNN